MTVAGAPTSRVASGPAPASAHEGPGPQFMLVPSLACPGECRYCFGPRSGPVMDEEMAARSVAWIARVVGGRRAREVAITFHGGEPLVAGHAVWRALLESIRRRLDGRALKLGLQSNLWLLDDEYCRLFREHAVEIGTSLDGPERMTDAQRGPGYFARTMAGIERARRWGLKVGCVATFTEQSSPRLAEAFEFFLSERLNVNVHAAVAVLDGPPGRHALSPDAFGRLLGQMLDLYLEHRRDIRVTMLDEMIRGVVDGRGCVCTFQDCLGLFLAIDPNGHIFPCQRFCGRPEYRIGRVDAAPTLENVLDSPIARRLAARQAAVRDACAECPHVAYCLGGCPYNAWAAGATTIRDPLCAAYRRVYDDLWERMIKEMETEENLERVASARWDHRAPLLLRRGPLAELARKGSHPTEVARTARRIIAAHELARDSNLLRVGKQLAARGICRSLSSAKTSLAGLESQLHPRILPLNKLYLHVTFRCAHRCDHCYVPADSSGAGMADMTPEAVEQVLYAARDTGFRRVVVTGGEPLCHTERDRLLDVLGLVRLRVRPISIGLRSNLALPMDDDLMWRVAHAADQIGVSIDGDRDSHDRRRGPGSYDAAVGNLERYLSLVGTVEDAATPMIAAVLTAAQARGEPGAAVWELAARLGVRKVRITPPLALGRAATWPTPPVMEPHGGALEPEEILLNGFMPASSCGLGQVLYVLPNGDAYPCRALRLPEWRLGSLVADGLAAVVGSERFRFLRARSVDSNRGCQRCAMRYICGGPCRAWYSGASPCDVDAPPLECGRRRKHAERLLDAATVYLGLSR